MLNFLRGLFDGGVKRGAAIATAYVAAHNPGKRIGSCWLRAKEKERYVFAVFCSEPEEFSRRPGFGPAARRMEFVVGLGPYQLVAVQRSTLVAERFDLSPGSPYAIRGVK